MVNHLIRNLLTAADPGFSGQFSLEEVAKLIESGIVLGSTSTRNSCYQLHTEAFYSYHFVALSLDNASPAGRLILYGQIQRSIRSAIQYKQADHRNLSIRCHKQPWQRPRSIIRASWQDCPNTTVNSVERPAMIVDGDKFIFLQHSNNSSLFATNRCSSPHNPSKIRPQGRFLSRRQRHNQDQAHIFSFWTQNYLITGIALMVSVHYFHIWSCSLLPEDPWIPANRLCVRSNIVLDFYRGLFLDLEVQGPRKSHQDWCRQGCWHWIRQGQSQNSTDFWSWEVWDQDSTIRIMLRYWHAWCDTSIHETCQDRNVIWQVELSSIILIIAFDILNTYLSSLQMHQSIIVTI